MSFRRSLTRRERVSLREIFGLKPFVPALSQIALTLRGDKTLPGVEAAVSSAKIFKPGTSIPLWLGLTRSDRLVPVYNFYNRNRRPISQPYSVMVSDVEDVTGGKTTYDSHGGTDFGIPVGTRVSVCAPGVVFAIRHEMNRGGRKVYVDHGDGLITTYNHLSRALVREGEFLGRGDIVGLSGMSGTDGVFFFPWLAPHLHLNVVLNGFMVDPFARDDEISLWRGRGRPLPAPMEERGAQPGEADAFKRSVFDPDGIEHALAECKDERVVDEIRGYADLADQGGNLVLHWTFAGPRFNSYPQVFAEEHQRRPVLDLPFLAEDYEGAAYPGE